MSKPITVQQRVAELVAEHGSYPAAASALGLSRSVLQKIARVSWQEGHINVMTLRKLGLKVGPLYEKS